MTGFVDLGDGLDETSVASEALVFMVVGLQGHWKDANSLLPYQVSDTRHPNGPAAACLGGAT